MSGDYKIHHYRLYNDFGGVMQNGGTTVVEHLPSGTFGVSVCDLKDTFSRKVGTEIAKKRALRVRQMGNDDRTVGVPPLDGKAGAMARAGMFDAYPCWQNSEALDIITPSCWVEIPNSHLPKILTVEMIEKREFKGYDYTELAEVWGLIPDEDSCYEKALYDALFMLLGDRADRQKIMDLRNYVRKLARDEYHHENMLWCGLSLIKDDWTFVKYCRLLLESMWS